MTQDEWNEEFAANLSEMMRENDMSIEELASETGMSKSVMYKYLNGTRAPGAKAIINISYALNCSIDDLIDFDEKID